VTHLPAPDTRRRQRRARLTPLLVAFAGVFGAHHAFAQNPSEPETTLAPVRVDASADASAEGLPPAYAGGQVTSGARIGILGNRSQLETPFTTTGYTSGLMQDQQARGVADVLLNDPAVRVARGFGNYQELYVVRGFPLYSDDMAYNGLYGVLPRQFVAAELLERVEVLRGANALVNGATPGGSGVGGAINLLPKRAPSTPLTRVTAGIESGGQGYVAADVARRFGPDQRTGVRLNAARRDGDTAIDDESRELTVFSVGLDYRGNDFRLSADAGFQDNRLAAGRPAITLGAGVAVPRAPDAGRNYSQPWVRSEERATFATLRGEVDLSADVTAWAALGARHSDERNDLLQTTLTAGDGTTSSYRFVNAREDDVVTGEVGLRGRATTGSIGHQWRVALATHHLDSRNAYAFSSFAGFAGNLYNPVTVAAPAANALIGGVLGSPRATQRTRYSSAAVADTLSFMQDTVLVTLGVRMQEIEDDEFDINTGALSRHYARSKASPMAAIVYRASGAVSLYANYTEGLVRGKVAPGGVVNAGQVFAPFVSRQKEIGVKYDGGRFGGTMAVFSTNQPDGQTDPVSNVFSVSGEQRNRGLELSFYGEPLRGTRLLGGATWLNAEQVSTPGGTNDGNDVIGVPDAQYNVGVEWDVPLLDHLTLTARVIRTASTYADAANTQRLPSWTRLDLGARYLMEVGEQLLTLRARLDNVADRDYWASAGGYPGSGYLVQGAPRTFVVSASVDF
jgi:iron complex outermembrane recepter protein